MNDFPFEEEEYCDECGTKGAYDIYGDYYCHDCLRKHRKEMIHGQKQKKQKADES